MEMKKRGMLRERIVRALLNNPDGTLTKYRLAKLSDCKFPYTHGFLKLLERQGIVAGTKVIDYPKLIHLWESWKTKPVARSYMIQDPVESVKESNMEYAATTYFAENLIQHYLFPTRLDIYVNPEDEEKWHQFLAKRGLVGKGNTRILVADKHVEFAASEVNGLKIVSTPQLIVDLYSEGGHCVDAANQLLEKEIAIRSATS